MSETNCPSPDISQFVESKRAHDPKNATSRDAYDVPHDPKPIYFFAYSAFHIHHTWRFHTLSILLYQGPMTPPIKDPLHSLVTSGNEVTVRIPSSLTTSYHATSDLEVAEGSYTRNISIDRGHTAILWTMAQCMRKVLDGLWTIRLGAGFIY